mgnify:CR=1 FL=1
MRDLKTADYQDIELTCVDCGATFTWTRGERYYYAGKGLSEPKRCPECRERRKLTLRPEVERG